MGGNTVDDNKIYYVMNTDFVLTNHSTDTNQESSSVHQAIDTKILRIVTVIKLAILPYNWYGGTTFF